MPNHLEQADKATQATTFTPESVYAIFASTAYEPRKTNREEKPANTTTDKPTADEPVDPAKYEAQLSKLAKDKETADLAAKAASADEKTKPPAEFERPRTGGPELVKQENPGEWWNSVDTAALAQRMRPLTEALQAAEDAKTAHKFQDLNASAAMGLSKLSKSGDLPGLLIVDDMNVNFKAKH